MKVLTRFLKFVKHLILVVSGLAFLLVVVVLSPSLWRHWITYPRLEKGVAAIQKLRKETPRVTSMKTYLGVLHGHSYWSHDSEGSLHDLVSAARKTGTGFIFLSDHPHGNSDTIPRGLQGLHDGVLIEPGSEKKGLNVWPLGSMVIDWTQDTDTIVQNLVKNGGLVLYSHPEEPHNWANPWFHGMEIYNFHADTEDESLYPQILNFTVNGAKYRHWAYREMFDEQNKIIALWDSLNCHRKIVGFAAIDAHENQNFRARYLDDGRVEWIGPNANVVDTMEVKWWNRWIFSEPDENGWIFKWMIDTYETGFGYVTNYLLADTLTSSSLASHIKNGHLYIAFNDLGDAGGFMYYSLNQSDSITGIMGDSVRIEEVKLLKAVSPLPGQFSLIHNGKVVEVSPDDGYSYARAENLKRGAYRIEIRLKLYGEHIPWLYSNPIYIY